MLDGGIVPKIPGVTVRQVQPLIGAEIGGIDIADAGDAEIDLIHKALLRYKVVFFRNQSLTRTQHVAFGRRFGELEVHPLSAHADHPEMLVLDSIGGLKEGRHAPAADFWHSDTTFRDTPSASSVLLAYKIPPLGGDTLWCNAAAVYAGLDDELKARIETLNAVHTGLAAFGHHLDTEEKRAAFLERHPPQSHPVVRIHPETGERLLYVNSGFTTRILDVSEEESDALLTRLFDEVKRPEYQVRFRWEVGSIAFWDNRSTQHYGVADYVGSRHLERVTVVGDCPVGPTGGM
ncbi:taurine dioxygenase [Croceicoccus estronivorus]|nr:taurine dioxygenase [Croceicoccus estronivorus]